MNDMTKPPEHPGAPVHASTHTHPDGHGKYASSVSYQDGMVALSLRYVERPWLPLVLFGRVIRTKMVRVAGEGVRETTLTNDSEGLVCTVRCDNSAIEKVSLLGPEWPMAMREAVRAEVDSSLHRTSRGISLQLKSRTSTAIVAFAVYALVTSLSGSNQPRATALGVAPQHADVTALQAPAAPQLTPSEASGMSSAAVAQAAADAQASPMPIKEALTKASYITVRAAGAGGKTLIVWSDPLCPNCRDFDQKILANLPATLGVTVIPVSFKHGSRPLVSYAACASSPADRAARWKNLMSEEPKGIDVTQQCETGPAVADANTSLFARAGLRATPTLMKPDGQMYEGDLQSAEAITNWLGK